MTVADPNDPSLKSWVETPPDSHFPIQNLPFGRFHLGGGEGPRLGVAIGEYVLNLEDLADAGLFDDLPDSKAFVDKAELKFFFDRDRDVLRQYRRRISQLLRDDHLLSEAQELRERALIPQSDVEMILPCTIGDYTDFYSSRHHAANVGTMLRGADNALQPNWLWLPVAYHGRSSSIVPSGTPIRRPLGQTKTDAAPAPAYGPSKALDYELELGFFVGKESELGEPIPIAQAEQHLFGVVLVNDWSARDIQKWEYVPLGPFLAKNFATTISPWVVTMEALEPFRCDGPAQDPPPLPHLRVSGKSAFDIQLKVTLHGADGSSLVICETNAKHLYWNTAQQLAHHTSNGCNVRGGDLLATGTISGPTKEARGCLLERTWGGAEPLLTPAGEPIRFLRDGDELVIEGWCQGDGYRVGFGTAKGRVLPALDA